jgi:hypothetical protein
MAADLEPRGNGAGVGGPARGYSWPPFEEENTAAVTHSAYALLLLRPRAEELACGLREAMGDIYEQRFEPAVAGAAMIGARLERATAALDDAKPNELARLESDARGWMRQWFNALAALGLTPASAVRIDQLRVPEDPFARAARLLNASRNGDR